MILVFYYNHYGLENAWRYGLKFSWPVKFKHFSTGNISRKDTWIPLGFFPDFLVKINIDQVWIGLPGYAQICFQIW